MRNGCLGDGHTDDDFIISGEMINELPELETQDQIIFEYNQWDSYDCTIYTALWALSDLWNREVTKEQFEETNEESYKRWRTPWEWRLVKEAVDLACDMWMKWYPNEKVAYYSISNYNDEEIKKVIDKNYTLCSWYNGNSEYNKDRRDNGQIDKSYFWTPTFGHSVGLIGREERRFVKDNYKWRKENWRYTNIYELIPEISELRKWACWHYRSYLIVKVKDEREEDIKRLNKMKNQLEKIIAASDILINYNSEMWHLTNDEEYKKQLHDTNEELRKQQTMNEKKKTDIERELAKYFKE